MKVAVHFWQDLFDQQSTVAEYQHIFKYKYPAGYP